MCYVQLQSGRGLVTYICDRLGKSKRWLGPLNAMHRWNKLRPIWENDILAIDFVASSESDKVQLKLNYIMARYQRPSCSQRSPTAHTIQRSPLSERTRMNGNVDVVKIVESKTNGENRKMTHVGLGIDMRQALRMRQQMGAVWPSLVANIHLSSRYHIHVDAESPSAHVVEKEPTPSSPWVGVGASSGTPLRSERKFHEKSILNYPQPKWSIVSIVFGHNQLKSPW